MTVRTIPSTLKESEMDEAEKISAAAVKFRCQVFAPLPPLRHHDALALLFSEHGQESIGLEEQGFVTSTGRFVDRIEGKRIAKRAGQLINRASKRDELCSEDMW